MDIISEQAHFAHMPSVSLEWDKSYPGNLAAAVPDAVHVVIRYQTGFRLWDGDARLPERVRVTQPAVIQPGAWAPVSRRGT